MKTQHTKGPWKVAVDTRYTRGLLVRDNNGEGYVVAVCDYVNNSNAKDVNNSIEANARLIAAAPELLEIVNRLLELVDSSQMACDHNLIIEAREVIAKATGE